MRPLALLALVLIVPCSTRSALAADYFVATTGSDDAGDGSSSAPWASIGHAAAQVGPGDVVHVAAGTYAEAVVSTMSGTESARIVFVSDAPWGAHVDATGNYTGWHNTGDYVDIVGFEVTGSDYLGIYNEGSYVRIVGNHVHDLATPTCNGSNGGAAIDHGNYDAHDNDTIGNIVHDVGMNLGDCNLIHGIYHSNLRGHIWNNIVYRAIGWGLHTWHAPADVTIANNLVFGNGRGGLVVGAGDSPGTGYADGFVVSNNIIIDNPIGIVEYGNFGPNNQYLNNLVHNNAQNLSLGNPDSGTLDVDPMLVDHQPDGSGDEHLAPGSPCIDSGVPDGAPPDDLEGTPRPVGAGFDIGPYEWHQDATGTGGSGGSGAGAGGAATGPGGSSSSSATSGGGEAGGASGAPAANEDSGGCACALPGATSAARASGVAARLGVVAAFAAAIALRRRRRVGYR